MPQVRPLDMRDQWVLGVVAGRLARQPGEDVIPNLNDTDRHNLARWAYAMFDEIAEAGESKIAIPPTGGPFGGVKIK